MRGATVVYTDEREMMEEYGTALFDGADIYDYSHCGSMEEASAEAEAWNEFEQMEAERSHLNVHAKCIVVTRTAPVEAGEWEPAIYNPTDVKEALYGAGKMGAP